MSIYSQLPNHLVMDIIRQADGGLNTHKSKFLNSLNIIKTQTSSVEPGNRSCREGVLLTYEPGNPFDGYGNIFWEDETHYPLDTNFHVCGPPEDIDSILWSVWSTGGD